MMMIYIGTAQARAWASAIRSWSPPIINNTLECPQGYVITPTNNSGVYECGPCLAYLSPSGSLSISCPR
ncbi:hypothetical protein [Vulcanisaeta sp. JCM 16159]|uniref:hypothetical protein n=1 Tax=Vulcanisaeta sp. JCM 16159 TaxID=1295371 RepID=UPI0006D0F4B2|nr:hypothetical protein [Vulcanisaeta sp. JCM 16159]